MNFKSIGKVALACGLFAGAAAVYAGVGGTTRVVPNLTTSGRSFRAGLRRSRSHHRARRSDRRHRFGLVRQSVVAAVIGISMAIVLQYGPDVIEGIVTSTAAGADLAQVALLDNGMNIANLVK